MKKKLAVGNKTVVRIAKKKSALDTQVAGGHYKNMVIQPVVFCQVNKLTFCESSVIKYVCRHRNKNKLQDLEKAKHFIDLLIDIEYAKKGRKK